MIELNKLRQITLDREARLEQNRLRKIQEYNIKQEQIFQEAIDNLEIRLIEFAMDGRHSLTVALFPVFEDGNISDKFHDKYRHNCELLIEAWEKIVFERDVIEYMGGNLKRVYEYLKENKLDPKIKYYFDMRDILALVIEW